MGAFIRSQREFASLSLRQLSEMADVSNAYLSQVERGLHEPSIRVVANIARALGIEPEVLLRHAGLLRQDIDGSPPPISTEQAIQADDNLTKSEKDVVLSVFRSFVDNKTRTT